MSETSTSICVECMMGLLTGRSYLLCSAPVVLWLQLTARIFDKRADIKEYSSEERFSPLSLPAAARTHIKAVGGGSDIRRFRRQSKACQVRLRQACGRLPLGKLWYRISPLTSRRCRSSCCFLSLPLEINSISLLLPHPDSNFQKNELSAFTVPKRQILRFNLWLAFGRRVGYFLQKSQKILIERAWTTQHHCVELIRSEDKHLIVKVTPVKNN